MKLREKLRMRSNEEAKVSVVTVRFIPSWEDFQSAEFISGLKNRERSDVV
jgi:hypothetical protein